MADPNKISHSPIVKRASQESHEEAIKEMSHFFENDKPQLGIFWFNPSKFFLFGVNKMDAEQCLAEGHHTFPKLHKTFWQKQHHRARAKNDTESMYFDEYNYTMIPTGRLFYIDNKYIVKVGDWINDLDLIRFTELIQDEFNLPDDFEFEIDEHWNLGHGWSEEKF